MRLLVVEDDAKTAAFVLKGLKESGYAVDHVSDGETGLHMALSEPYDTAIIDVMLPKLDGLALIGELRRKKNKLPVIILSARGSTDDRVKGLETGSDDYLTKPFSFSELLARVQALLRRASGVSEPTSLTVGDLSINLLTRQVTRGDNKIELQPREFALLEYLMRSAGRVVSKNNMMVHVLVYKIDPRGGSVHVPVEG
jgi:two-component system OmpR family response regulator